MAKMTEAKKAAWQKQRAQRAAEIAAWKRPWRKRHNIDEDEPIRRLATTI
jgi:hypothetical protein|tara:strand:- start:1791 stop:1940 length:150 start_codon:yes stop_codon:yes gene_type:complete